MEARNSPKLSEPAQPQPNTHADAGGILGAALATLGKALHRAACALSSASLSVRPQGGLKPTSCKTAEVIAAHRGLLQEGSCASFQHSGTSCPVHAQHHRIM